MLSEVTAVRVLVIEYRLVANLISGVVRFALFKCLLQRFFLKRVHAQNLQNVVEASFGLELFFHNRD